MRTYELRVYTLASAEAVHAYLTVYYPNHQVSLAKLFDVTVHGFFSPVDNDAHQVHVLFSYPEGTDPDDVRQRYMAAPESRENMPGFDPRVIRGVATTLLTPAEGSALL